ncbi:MAG TPA: transglycosylase domain-containing protein [Micromonosporaceae bacterium]
MAIALLLLLSGTTLTVGTYYVDSVPTPEELSLPEATTVYFADGQTPMAKLGQENRTILKYEEMNDAVKEAIVAAEDQTFWTNAGIDFKGVLRAAWNNVSGGATQGASTITQQYARVAADLQGVTYSRKLREAVIAWKLARKHSKEEILGFYLNTVPFGRGAYGIEAAAQVFMGKTANRNAPAAQQVTVAEAMVLVAMVKQPEADPADPDGSPGYDPTRGSRALANSQGRWAYVRDSMVKIGYLTATEAARLRYPIGAVKEYDASARQSGLERTTGLAVNHVLSELRQSGPLKGTPEGYIEDGGFRIVTTIDKRVQDAAEAAADIRRDTAPEVVQGQPDNWQAALVAVEPGTGRVLAYYGGNSGSGADYAGWYFDAEGNARGFGQHPPGSTFKVYDMIAAQQAGLSLDSVWDSPATKEFPASGRTKGTKAGPVRNSSTAACQPTCTLVEAAVASLNVPFFDLTEQLGAPAVIDMAHRAGIDHMWASVPGQANPVRIDLSKVTGEDLRQYFSTEVGIGQYGVTVSDHANGMATLAAGGKRAKAHFVRSVTKGDTEVYREDLTQTDIGLDQARMDELSWALSKVGAAKLDNGWDTAGKTGTWQAGDSTTKNAHTWMVGYAKPLAAAVWLGTRDGKALTTKNGRTDVFGGNYPGPIWQQFMRDALAALKLNPDEFRFTDPTPTPSVTPSATSSADPSPSTEPSIEPTLSPEPPGPTEPPASPTLPPATFSPSPSTKPSP